VTIKNEGCVSQSDESFEIIEKTKGSGVKFTNLELRKLNKDSGVGGLLRDYRKAQIAFTSKIFSSSSEYIPAFEDVTYALGVLDVLVSFSVVATSSSRPYCRPELLTMGSGVLELEECRHPVVETSINEYIPNDVRLGQESSRFVVLMGANMGGKSTYLRSAALAVFMAQIGSFVACSSAKLSAVDGIFTRVGADDYLDQGVSTFMAEMTECSTVLKEATENSLVIIDELGRGTSTDDGFGLAFAIAEEIIKRIRAFTLFATHFHELASLQALYPMDVVNLKMDTVIDEQDGELVFLYQVVDGAADKSLGIRIARMVGFPQEVVEDAESILRELDGD